MLNPKEAVASGERHLQKLFLMLLLTEMRLEEVAPGLQDCRSECAER